MTFYNKLRKDKVSREQKHCQKKKAQKSKVNLTYFMRCYLWPVAVVLVKVEQCNTGWENYYSQGTLSQHRLRLQRPNQPTKRKKRHFTHVVTHQSYLFPVCTPFLWYCVSIWHGLNTMHVCPLCRHTCKEAVR